jgi:hypothetical protein
LPWRFHCPLELLWSEVHPCFEKADEEIELLEQYKGQLQREIAGVDTRIGELKKEGTD